MAFSGNHVCSSFKKELLEAEHNFDSDTFKMALYTDSASLDAQTTEYSTTHEVIGTGYTAGGATLSIASTPGISGTTAFVDFADVTWAASTITARGALIYNASNGNKAVAVLDFGSNRSSNDSDFTITFPTPNASNAIIRIA